MPLLGIHPVYTILLGIYHNSTRCMLPNIHCRSISNSQVMEAIKMSINSGMDEDVVPVYHRILLSQRNEGNNAICSNMDGPRNCHNE